MLNFFISRQANIIMLLMIPVIIVTQLYGFSLYSLIMQLLMYFFVAYNAECLVDGGCGLWSWISISFPLLYSLLYIFFASQLQLAPAPPRPPTIIMPIERVPTPPEPKKQ